MGYTLVIGELKTQVEKDGLDSYISHEAEIKNINFAPAFGEPTDYENQRWPSYTSWHDSMRFVGLYDFMFNKENGLIRSHPDCIPLTIEHKEIIDKAYKDFYSKYPNCKAGYSPKVKEDPFAEDYNWPKENGYATRLEWLKFWVDWSLENCENPVFYNS
jgi:hypothetical protein